MLLLINLICLLHSLKTKQQVLLVRDSQDKNKKEDGVVLDTDSTIENDKETD